MQDESLKYIAHLMPDIHIGEELILRAKVLVERQPLQTSLNGRKSLNGASGGLISFAKCSKSPKKPSRANEPFLQLGLKSSRSMRQNTLQIFTAR